MADTVSGQLYAAPHIFFVYRHILRFYRYFCNYASGLCTYQKELSPFYAEEEASAMAKWISSDILHLSTLELYTGKDMNFPRKSGRNWRIFFGA